MMIHSVGPHFILAGSTQQADSRKIVSEDENFFPFGDVCVSVDFGIYVCKRLYDPVTSPPHTAMHERGGVFFSGVILVSQW